VSSASLLWWVIPVVFLLILLLIAFTIHCVTRYVPVIARIFEFSPQFRPRIEPTRREGQTVTFPTTGGIQLTGTYLPRRRGSRRVGVAVVCPEYLGNRWGALHYIDWLRDLGFDLFCFDFRNQGESQSDPSYHPLQWVTRHEVADVLAAVAYLDSRPDADPAGYLLFGISRGGGAALGAAAKTKRVWGVVTDGAFPVKETMLVYLKKWANTFVRFRGILPWVPDWFNHLLCRLARWSTSRRLGCRYVNVGRAAARMSPRPWLAIHGQKDQYVPVEVARALAAYASPPRLLHVVPRARHNKAYDVDPQGYRAIIETFLERFAPRLPDDRPHDPHQPARLADSPTPSSHPQVAVPLVTPKTALNPNHDPFAVTSSNPTRQVVDPVEPHSPTTLQPDSNPILTG